jgi:hypothetical protein
VSPSLRVESLDYQPTIYAMKIIEPLQNELEENTNDDADGTENTFAPWNDEE